MQGFAPCPHCGIVPTEREELCPVDRRPGPPVLDVTLCEHCVQMSVYQTDGTRRRLTPDELRDAIRRLYRTYGLRITSEIAVAAVFGLRQPRVS